MQALKAYGYNPVTLDEVMRARAGIGTMPAKPVVITFDDGNETLLTHVFPVLADPSIDFKATSFFLTGKAGQPATWDNDCCIVTRHLTWEEVETLHNSGRIDFQSHGVNHPYYPNLSLPELYADMVESRQTLETRLQKPVRFLAYPYGGYGSYNQNIVQTARAAGYFAGVTAWGDMERDCTNKYVLRRVAVNFNSSLDYSPDSPEFFFNFDDTFVVPEISVNEITLLDGGSQAPLTEGQVWPGQTIKIQVIATNAGPPAETIAVIQLGRDGDTNQIVYDSHLSDPSMDKRTNFVTGNQSFEWVWPIPTNTPPGRYQVHVKFYDKHYLLGLHDAGWHPAFDLQALLPDLRAEAVTLSTPLTASATGDAEFRVANIGSADAGPFECKIVLSPTEGVGEGLTVLGQIAIPGLPQGQSTSGVYSVSFPDWIRPNRTYYLGLIADDPGGLTNFGSVLEANGQEVTNNLCWQSVVWQASPPAPIIDAANSTHATNQWSTNRQVDIRWTCITELFDIVGYAVVADSVPDTEPPTTVTTTNQNWSLENVLDTATLYLHVRSQDGGGQWSTTTHFGPIMIDNTPPSCPELVKPVNNQNVSRTELLFDWSDVADNLSSVSYDYRLFAEVENDGELETLEELSISNLVTSTYMLEGLQPRDGRYYWSTRACDAAGNKSEWTAWESFWPCSATGAVDLVVGYYEQEKFEHGWGWAAGLSMLLSYSGNDLKPWEIASEFQAGIGDAASVPTMHGWLQTNYPAVTWIEESLEYAPVNRVIGRCAAALSQGGPVLVGRENTPWLWPPAHGSDAIVLVGYEGLNGTDVVYFHDPGNGIANANVISRTLTWGALVGLLSEKWSSLGGMRMLYASAGTSRTNSPGLALALMPGTGYRAAGLRWEHMRDGTNCSAWLAWDGKDRSGYYYTSAAPEEFPVDPTAGTNELALAVTVRDDLVVTPFIANSFSNALHVEFEGRIFGTNGTEAVHFINTNRVVIPPYTAETREDLAIIQRLSSVPFIEPGHEYALEIVVNGYASEGGQLLASDTNRFKFRVEPWPMGSIQIFANPELTNSNFGWRLDGGAWQMDGVSLDYLSLGTHLLEFKNIDGWTAPSREWVVISNTEPIIITRAYTEGGSSVQVTLEPPEALAAGAGWRIDGGEWFESAFTLGGINPGEHLLEFKEASGWLAPSNTTVMVESNRVLETSQAYTKRGGSLRVTVSPGQAAVSGAYWQTDGTGSWHRSGDTISALSAGTHQINFSDLGGWIKPAAMDVTVKENEIADLGATYTQAVGSATVTISPPAAIQAGAQWRLEGGQWRDSGFVETNITSGAYMLEFKSLTGMEAPLGPKLNGGSRTGSQC